VHVLQSKGDSRLEAAAPFAFGDRDLQIVDIKTVVVNAELRNWVFVKVQTKGGLYGWGEATLEWKTRAVVGAIEDLKPLVLGRDARDIEQAVTAMRKQSFWRLGVIGTSALSGIELALWDIFGKSVGLPVWRLLGGSVRDRLRVYTHLGFGDMRAVYETDNIATLIERAHAVLERGYRAMKVVIVPYAHYLTDGKALRHVEKLMGALRETVGEEIDIMVDFHGRCASASLAVAFIERLAPFRPLFVEEPVPPGATKALREVTQKVSVPIAAGERLIDRMEFADLFEQRAVAIAQPDICHCGGLWEARKIAAMAETAGIGVAPHNPLGPIAGAAALHFGIATPNVVIQEEMTGAVPWYWEVMSSPVVMTDGFWSRPATPGLGVEVDEVVAARHPYVQEVLHSKHAVLDDGTIVDW
jgi:galactonate dehydratase